MIAEHAYRFCFNKQSPDNLTMLRAEPLSLILYQRPSL